MGRAPWRPGPGGRRRLLTRGHLQPGRSARPSRSIPASAALLPAVGYGDEQVADLEDTIRRVPCDLVIVATPVDLTRIIRIDKPMLRVRYSLKEIGTPTLEDVLKERLK